MDTRQLALAAVDDRAAPVGIGDHEALQVEQSPQVENRQPDLDFDREGTCSALRRERRIIPGKSLATLCGSPVYPGNTARA